MYTGRYLRRLFTPAAYSNVPAHTRLATWAPVHDDWQLADTFRRPDGGQDVIFTAEEVDAVAEQVLGPTYSTYRIQEPDDRQVANIMLAADMEMRSPTLQELMPTLRNLLNNPEIQRACMGALKNDVNFRQVMQLGPAAAAPLEIEWKPKWNAEADGAGIGSLLADLGARLKASGQAALNTAAGMKTALGRFLIQSGASLHALLGQPFSTAPLEEGAKGEDEDDLNARADQVGQALIMVAVTILSIVFLKRAHLV